MDALYDIVRKEIKNKYNFNVAFQGGERRSTLKCSVANLSCTSHLTHAGSKCPWSGVLQYNQSTLQIRITGQPAEVHGPRKARYRGVFTDQERSALDDMPPRTKAISAHQTLVAQNKKLKTASPPKFKMAQVQNYMGNKSRRASSDAQSSVPPTPTWRECDLLALQKNSHSCRLEELTKDCEELCAVDWKIDGKQSRLPLLCPALNTEIVDKTVNKRDVKLCLGGKQRIVFGK